MMVDIILEDELTRFLKCIGEPTRLKILKLLAEGDKCVGDITVALNREQSLISHHLRMLKECEVVRTEQVAQKIYYKLADQRIAELILISESLIKEIPLCQRGECNAGE